MKYHLVNFLGVLLIYAVVVSMFSYIGGEVEYGMGIGANVAHGGYFDWKQGLGIMGIISGFIIAYMVTKNFKDHGGPL